MGNFWRGSGGALIEFGANLIGQFQIAMAEGTD